MTVHEKILAGKKAVVTGGSRGIGAALVQRFLDSGAEVLTTARSESAPVPAGAAFVRADMRTRVGVGATAEAARDILGDVDILIHTVGGSKVFPRTLDIPEEEWREELNRNLLSAVRLDLLLAPAMRDRGTGAIVHFSSAAVAKPVPQVLHYSAAKVALEAYSQGLAAELAPSGVRVNTVTPGRIATPGGVATREQWGLVAPEGSLATATPLGRDGQPDDIVEATMYLVSDRASFVTGINLIVDGGEFPRG
uniref:oxidoreductase n=1 Tax=Paractinoplanes polyasparticus TaxID=2856853 RepID=UPI001C8519B9|nr:oxidoreductase [Actinoplanes polyasparticus]